jgi:hypothetical protein
VGPTVHIPETERRRRQGGAATARVGRNGDAARSPRVRALSYRGSTGLNGYGLGSAGVLGLARSVPLFLDTSSAEALRLHFSAPLFFPRSTTYTYNAAITRNGNNRR